MEALVSRAAMILLSLHPSPASEISAFNKMRAFSSRCAGLFPLRIKPSNCSRSSALSRTTYLFTDFSRAAIVPSVARTTTEANHQILSNWLKRATRLERDADNQGRAGRHTSHTSRGREVGLGDERGGGRCRHRGRSRFCRELFEG